jgi:hypothetical protein
LAIEALAKSKLSKQESKRSLSDSENEQCVSKKSSEPAPNRTRSGRKIKPVENFYSLKSSLAMEALAKSNLLEQKDKMTASDSEEDHEVSFKENLPPVKAKSKRKQISTPKANKKKRGTHRRCSLESTDSDEDYEVKKKKKKHVNKNLRTPQASKYLKPAPLDTPCVIPLRLAFQIFAWFQAYFMVMIFFIIIK